MTVMVKEIRADEDWVPNSPHRSKGIHVKNVIQRSVENRSVEFNITSFDGSAFWSPAHRHNFDQIRIGLEGVMGYTGKHKLKPRTVAYYPQGTWYGPMEPAGASISAIMQFDGATNCGYVTLNRMDVATEELLHEGRFEKGFFLPNDGSQKIDGYQASWERVTGRQMVYPEPRYTDPVYMNIDSFAWRGNDGEVKRKTLGRFGERDFTIDAYLVPAGKTLTLGTPGRLVVGFVLTGHVNGGGAELRHWSGTLLEEGDTLDLTGVAEASEVLVFTLPDHRD